MDIDEQIKLLEEQVGSIKGLRNLNHRDSRFISWKRTTLSHLRNIFTEGSDYVRRFEALSFQEPRLGGGGSSRPSYGDMGFFGHDLDRAQKILDDGIEELKRIKPPKLKSETILQEPPPDESPPKEPSPEDFSSDDTFFERSILEKTLSEDPVAGPLAKEDLTVTEEALKPSYEEKELSLEEVIQSSQEESEPPLPEVTKSSQEKSEPPLQEVIKSSQEKSEPPLEEVMKSSQGEKEPSIRNQAVDEVVQYVSSLLYHYVSLEEDPKRKKALQKIRAELDNPKRSRDGIVKALQASWDEGKDVLVDVIARVFAKKQ
jgi:hypothetical protein